MSENMCGCYDMETFKEYFSNNLDLEKRKEIEKHFCDCTICSQLAREMNKAYLRQRVVKANTVLGVAFERFGDTVEVKAAGDTNMSSVRELVTKNGKFRVTLRPLQKKPENALLEVQVLDSSIKGRIKIAGTTNFHEVVEIDQENRACVIVNSSIELNRIIISKSE